MQRRLGLWSIILVPLGAALLLAPIARAQQELTLTLDTHRFSPAEMRVPAHTPFVLTIVNKDKEDEEFEVSALRLEKIIPGGKTLPLKMPALKPGTYEFVGEFHENTAQGRIITE